MDENKVNKPEQEENKKKKGLLCWWNKLSKGAKIGISAGGVVALASAIVFPILGSTVWKKSDSASKTFEATWNADNEVYTSSDFNNVSVGTKFSATVIYNTIDTAGFNLFAFNHNDGYYDAGINAPSATINVTQIKYANGSEITNKFRLYNNYFILSDSFYKQNISVTFTVTKNISSLCFYAQYSN